MTELIRGERSPSRRYGRRPTVRKGGRLGPELLVLGGDLLLVVRSVPQAAVRSIQLCRGEELGRRACRNSKWLFVWHL